MGGKDGLKIRSTSAEFLIFERQKGEKNIDVRFEGGVLWLTQKLISELFNTIRNNITIISKIYTNLLIE